MLNMKIAANSGIFHMIYTQFLEILGLSVPFALFFIFYTYD